MHNRVFSWQTIKIIGAVFSQSKRYSHWFTDIVIGSPKYDKIGPNFVLI